jgi:hypothetical protein
MRKTSMSQLRASPASFERSPVVRRVFDWSALQLGTDGHAEGLLIVSCQPGQDPVLVGDLDDVDGIDGLRLDSRRALS